MADPEIWGAIHRLAVVMEKLDLRGDDFVQTDGYLDDFKNAAKKALSGKDSVASDDWASLDPSIQFPTSTLTPPSDGRTIKIQKEWIKYYNAKIKEMDGHIKIIRDDYAKQLKQATAAV
jgi:hypothetical protein